MMVMMITNTSATAVYVPSSLRVGQITFRSSAATCRTKTAGVVFSRLSARPDPLRRSALWPVWVANVLTCAALYGPPRAGRLNRAGPDSQRWQGRRDSNPQPPVLETGTLPIELLPYGLQSQECTANAPLASNRMVHSPRETKPV